MIYIGRYQLGDWVPLRIQATNGSLTPTLPDDCPLMAVYSAAGSKVVEKKIPVLERYAVTGLFAFRLFLDGSYSAGSYMVKYQWLISSAPFIEVNTFEIVAGGHVDGSAIASAWYERPHGKFLVRQMDSHKLVEGRNPRI